MDWDYKERIHFYLITQNQGDNTRTYKNEKIKIYRKEVLKELRPNLNHLYRLSFFNSWSNHFNSFAKSCTEKGKGESYVIILFFLKFIFLNLMI